mgnify:CR=1 FL=1
MASKCVSRKIKLCTDNGAMVAMLGVNLVESGVKTSTEPEFRKSIPPCR